MEKKYSSHIIFQSLGAGKDTLITFKNKAKYLIEEKYKKDSDMNTVQEEERMLNIVGEIIRIEIRDIKQPDMYPCLHDLSDMEHLRFWIPKSLAKLLGIVNPNELKGQQ